MTCRSPEGTAHWIATNLGWKQEPYVVRLYTVLNLAILAAQNCHLQQAAIWSPGPQLTHEIGSHDNQDKSSIFKSGWRAMRNDMSHSGMGWDQEAAAFLCAPKGCNRRNIRKWMTTFLVAAATSSHRQGRFADVWMNVGNLTWQRSHLSGHKDAWRLGSPSHFHFVWR